MRVAASKIEKKKILGFFHCPSDIGVYDGVVKKANNCWRVSCSNIYKIYSAKFLKKTRLIYECPSMSSLLWRAIRTKSYTCTGLKLNQKPLSFFVTSGTPVVLVRFSQYSQSIADSYLIYRSRMISSTHLNFWYYRIRREMTI